MYADPGVDTENIVDDGKEIGRSAVDVEASEGHVSADVIEAVDCVGTV